MVLFSRRDPRRSQDNGLGNRGAISPKAQIEQEKRIRREIANSNERRRMQSINNGFQSLRSLLPQRDGEKMSKAAILQHTADYIEALEEEKTRLLSQQCTLKRLLQQHGLSSASANDSDNSDSGSKVPVKRKRTVESIESADEGIGMSPSHCERELISELRYQLDREREMRRAAERRAEQALNERDGRINLVIEEHSSEAEEYIKEEMVEECTEEFVVTDDLPQDLSCATATGIPQQEITVISKPSVVVLPVHGVNMVAAQQLTPAPSPPRCHSPSVTNSAPLNNPAVTSRKNLDTIVEAIRHLEGDHMFNERRPNENCRANNSLSDSGVSRSETVIVRSSIVTTPSSKATQPTAADRR